MASDISQIPVPVGQSAQAWTGIPGSTDTVLFWNQDLNNTVYLGYKNQIIANGATTIPVPPNGTFPLPASRNVFVIGSAQGISPLVVIPGAATPFRSLTQGLGALVLPAIFSPNFITGISGWAIRKDGSAEFNNLTIRGTFLGANFIINNLGAFFYSGTPALGNLIASITSAPGANDGLGNPFKAGITVYATAGTTFVEMLAGNPALLNVGTGDSAEATPPQYNARVVGAGPTRYILSDIRAARVTGENANAIGEIQIFSPTADLTVPPGVNIVANDGTNQGLLRVISLGTQVSQGDFFVGSAGNTGFRVTQSHTGEADMFSPKQTIGDTPAEMALLSALQTGAFPLVQLIGTNFNAVTANQASVLSDDSWHTLTLNGATGTVQYSHEPNGPNGKGLIRLNGEAILSGATAANFVLATIPFTFPRVTDVITPNNLAGAALGQRVARVDTNGNLVIIPTGAVNNFVIFDNIEAPLA